MTARLDSFVSARLLVPNGDTAGRPELNDRSHGVSLADADGVARDFLEAVGRASVRTLVVEDDLAVRGDPCLGPDVAYVDDRVVRWTGLDDDAAAAVSLLRSGSSGYPLNAFGVNRTAGELGLRAGCTLSPDEQTRIVESTTVVVTSLYDGEAFLALTDRHDHVSRRVR